MNKEEVNSLLENVARSIYKIEDDLGMPINTLQKAMKGERLLPKRWAIALKHYVETRQYLVTKPTVTTKKEVPADDKKQDDKKEKDSGEDWTKLSRTEQMKRLRG